MKSYFDWLKFREAVAQHYLWSDEDIDVDKSERDFLGLPKMKRPGFRKQDKAKIRAESDQAEKWLNGVTNRYGINWVVIYGEPMSNERDDEEGWKSYSSRMNKIAGDKFEDFVAQWQPSHPEERPPTPQNTIVYVKPTSRVHGLTAHQQVHNIGHAIWGYAGDMKQKAYQKMSEIVSDVRRKAHQAAPDSEPPTTGEVVMTMARLLNLKSMNRIFDMNPGDFDKPAKALNQVYGSIDEFMYEIIAAFFRGGGWVYLKPRGSLGGALEPRQAIMQHNWGKPGDWAWQELANDPKIWKGASLELTEIVVEALKKCVWAKVGRPIYATYKSLTTEP